MSVLSSVAARLVAEDETMADDAAALTAALENNTTDCFEVLHRLVRAADESAKMADATKERLADLSARAARFTRRKDTMRAAILAALDALGLPKLETPEFTVTLRAGVRQAVVTDEIALPDEYWRVQRSPDLSAIRADTKIGVIIPGVEMTNAAPSIQIRSK